MLEIRLIPRKEFERIQKADLKRHTKLELIGDMCRANALATVKRAGSGHLGSSFSSLDIVTLLYHYEMNTVELGIGHSGRDIYFSSKGHDAPGHYAVLYSLGIISQEQFVNLRRLGGTHGHPDVNIPGIEANSGSLGMGISKAKGMAIAKKMTGHGGRVFVMTGDGELQEGQIWESLQSAVQQKVGNLHVIVDFNKIQSDKAIREIVDLGDLEKKFEVFGWDVQRCDGHDFAALEKALQHFRQVDQRPKVLIADTVKGRGVSFMEGPADLAAGGGLYRWHAGAPGDDDFEAGYAQILDRINRRLEAADLQPVATEIIETREKYRRRLKDSAEKVVDVFGQALVELGSERKDLVVLDADLSADCGLRAFENAFPQRFIENGIAEQDMVSTAGGLALQGLLPIVNSFGVFLASRANEQIYTNATEKTKIIYVCHFAGLIPAGPGKSHQSLRDISLFGALPNCVIIEPCNAAEVRQVLRWCIYEAEQSCMLRLVISPSPRAITLPQAYALSFGRGTVIREGGDAVLFAYGPVMLHEALVAGEVLEKQGIQLKVVDMPWLNRVDADWLREVIGGCDAVFTVDNHAPYGGLGDCLLNVAAESGLLHDKQLVKFAVEGFPACGRPPEVLRHHRLDGESLAGRIANKMNKSAE